MGHFRELRAPRSPPNNTKRHGAKREEFETTSNMKIPRLLKVQQDEAAYQHLYQLPASVIAVHHR